jgi:hypothetical protein
MTRSNVDDLPFDERFDRAVRVAIETGFWVAEHAARRDRRGDRARAYFEALAEAFALYGSPENWKTGGPRCVLPALLAQTVGGLARYLASGKIPEPIAHCARRGAVVGPSELRDIRRAAIYIDAVKRKVIVDVTPVKTVAALYDCRRTTVQTWSKKYRHTITDDERAIAPHLIKKQMKDAASRYSEAGRSRASVARRDRKKSAS